MLHNPKVSKLNRKMSKFSKVPSYHNINYGSFMLSTSQTCNSYCYLKNNDIFCISNIFIKNCKIFLEGKTLINFKNLEIHGLISNLLEQMIFQKTLFAYLIQMLNQIVFFR